MKGILENVAISPNRKKTAILQPDSQSQTLRSLSVAEKTEKRKKN